MGQGIDYARTVILIIGTGIGSAFITVVGNIIVNHYLSNKRERKKEEREKERDGRYLALRLAIILERYAGDCALAIADNHDFRSSKGSYGHPRSELPKIQDYPRDADWKNLAPSLANKALSLVNELEFAQVDIDFIANVDHEEAATSLLDDRAAQYGLKAWNIARSLRTQYGLPDFDAHNDGWNFIKMLQKAEKK